MKGLRTIVAMLLTTTALVGMNGYCAKATTTGNDDTVIVKKSDSEEKKDSLNIENEKNKSDSTEQSKLDELNKKANSAGKSDSKPENNNQTPAKIVDSNDNAAASVVLTGSNTAVKVYDEKTVNGTTYYKVEANRGVKADKAHVVSIGGQATTKHLPQTGAKNEIIAAISGLTVASVGIASAMGMSRRKKNN